MSIKEVRIENVGVWQATGPDRSQMDFFTDGQFLPIPRELVFIFDKITYYLCLICNGRDR